MSDIYVSDDEMDMYGGYGGMSGDEGDYYQPHRRRGRRKGKMLAAMKTRITRTTRHRRGGESEDDEDSYEESLSEQEEGEDEQHPRPSPQRAPSRGLSRSKLTYRRFSAMVAHSVTSNTSFRSTSSKRKRSLGMGIIAPSTGGAAAEDQAVVIAGEENDQRSSRQHGDGDDGKSTASSRHGGRMTSVLEDPMAERSTSSNLLATHQPPAIGDNDVEGSKKRNGFQKIARKLTASQSRSRRRSSKTNSITEQSHDGALTVRSNKTHDGIPASQKQSAKQQQQKFDYSTRGDRLGRPGCHENMPRAKNRIGSLKSGGTPPGEPARRSFLKRPTTDDENMADHGQDDYCFQNPAWIVRTWMKFLTVVIPCALLYWHWVALLHVWISHPLRKKVWRNAAFQILFMSSLGCPLRGQLQAVLTTDYRGMVARRRRKLPKLFPKNKISKIYLNNPLMEGISSRKPRGGKRALSSAAGGGGGSGSEANMTLKQRRELRQCERNSAVIPHEELPSFASLWEVETLLPSALISIGRKPDSASKSGKGSKRKGPGAMTTSRQVSLTEIYKQHAEAELPVAG